MVLTKFGVGQAVTRKEDDPILRGAGRYVADHVPAGVLQAAVLRSPHAHARFRIANAEAARNMPGVHLVLTAADIGDLAPLPCHIALPGVEIKVPRYPVLAEEDVRHVGDAVAFIVAETIEQARDAAEAIAVDWEPQPHVVDAAAALNQGAAPVWPDRPGNLAFATTMGDEAATQAAFAAAARTVSLTLINQRLVTNFLDTRGVVAEYDAAADRTTLTLSSQGSHAVRDVLCEILDVAPERLRVVTPDVGGGFGTKLFTYREYALVAVAARRLSRPVRWISERTEHFLADAQGRDNITTARLALDENNRFLALEVDLIADMGAYLSAYAPFIPFIGAGMLPGVYDIPACHIHIRGAYTNTVPVDAYRGAGRPEAAYVIERLVDVAARDLGLAPDALRRKNFIKPKAMPYATQTGKIYDSGDFAAHMARAQEIADWAGFKGRVAQSRKQGRLRGIGLATYIEACGSNGPDPATVRLEQDGTITVLAGSQSTGQGHQTAYAQLVAEHLGVAPERVRVIQGDTAVIQSGAGTGGSSSISCGGASVAGASGKLAAQLRELAADALEAAPGDLEVADEAVRVSGTDRAISFSEIARWDETRPHMLTASDSVAPSAPTYPNGTHLCEVEIDPDSGAIRIANYVVVDDFGVTLNPLLLEGQVHGGAVQGIGQALMERTVYDAESGQLVSASLMDYALPRASDCPSFIFETRNVPTPANTLGVKGAGEAGAIGSCPALMNAIADALWRAARVRHVDMPATPERVWQAIEEGRRLHTL
jgi:aerobic carbon-monoxide dehydrogenase large subunit